MRCAILKVQEDEREVRRTIGRASLARENEAGGRRSIYSMLIYRTLFCFGRNNRNVPK